MQQSWLFKLLWSMLSEQVELLVYQMPNVTEYFLKLTIGEKRVALFC